MPKLYKRTTETSYRSIKLHLKRTSQRAYRHELQTKLSQKPWRQEIANTPDWPRRKAVAEFRLFVGHDCLGTHLHRLGIRPVLYCMLCKLREPTDWNHLGQSAALANRTECERYWEAGQDENDRKQTAFPPHHFFYPCDYCLLLGLLCVYWMVFFYWSRRSMMNNQMYLPLGKKQSTDRRVCYSPRLCLCDMPWDNFTFTFTFLN